MINKPAASQPDPAAGVPAIPPPPLPILVSLATGPVLGALVISKTVANAIITLGLSSEEIFRGDRLPILPFSPTPAPSPPDQ